MSKKTKWQLVASSEDYKLMTEEEREDYRKDKRKKDEQAFKFGLYVDKMPVNRPKFKKAPKKETNDED